MNNKRKILTIVVPMLLLMFAPTYTNAQLALPISSKTLVKNNLDSTAMTTYCNTRFSFCFDYPAQYFIDVQIGDNEDGIYLNSPKNGVQIIAYGYHAINKNTEKVWANNIRILEKNMEDATVKVDLRKNDSIQAEYTNEYHHVFTQTILHDDIWTTLEIQVKNRPNDTTDEKTMQYLKDIIIYTFEADFAYR